MSTSFLADTTTQPLEPGIRTALITDAWNTPLEKPNGGYALAIMTRALMDELDVGRPAGLAITYLAPPEPGIEARFEIRTIKLGRRIQTAEVQMNQGDRPVAHLVANFLRDHEGISQELGTPPDLPAPDDCLDPKVGNETPTGIFQQLDHRWTHVPGWARGEPTGDPSHEFWLRLAGGVAIDWPALALLTDAMPPPILELGVQVSMTVQLTVQLHRLPAPGSWVAAKMTTRHAVNGMHEEDGELWDEDGNLLAQSRQLAILL